MSASEGMDLPALEEKLQRHMTLDPSGCWLWTGGLDSTGYGGLHLRIRGRATRRGAHRIAYLVWNGEIPEGMTVDHVCFQTRCINPAHLRLLTREDNSRFQRNYSPTHCPHGHELTPENVAFWRKGRKTPSRACRTCKRERIRAYRRRLKTAS